MIMIIKVIFTVSRNKIKSFESVAFIVCTYRIVIEQVYVQESIEQFLNTYENIQFKKRHSFLFVSHLLSTPLPTSTLLYTFIFFITFYNTSDAMHQRV